MQEGDMVRFALWSEVDVRDSKNWHKQPKNHIGVLVEHDKLLGTAVVLYGGEVYKLRSIFVEKAGKRDFASN